MAAVKKAQRDWFSIVFTLIIISLLFWSRNFFAAASVNGKLIHKSAVMTELEKQAGKQVLDGLVAEKLILEEAKKRNIQITDKEIEEEISRLEKTLVAQGQKLDDALKMQGLTRDDFKRQIRTQKVVEKLLEKETKVTDKEIDDFIKENQAVIPTGATQAELRQGAAEQLRQNKLREKVQELVERLRKAAKTELFVNY